MAENQMELHPIAKIFPLMEGVEFRELVEDIRTHGLREPIVLFEGEILDGRNRYRACLAAQADPRYELYGGNDPLAFVASVNLHRRHLDASQRAMIAAELMRCERGAGSRGPLPKPGRRDRGGRLLRPEYRFHGEQPQMPMRVSAKEAADLLNVSDATVRHAYAVIKRGSPDVITAVKAGKLAVDAAHELVLLPKDQQQKIVKASAPTSIGSIARKNKEKRLAERRSRRAAAGVSSVAVFDHVKIGDGRSIGNVRMGELDRIEAELLSLLHVLRGIRNHCQAESSTRVRDAISEAAISEIFANAIAKAKSA